jgi:hypothetical protein
LFGVLLGSAIAALLVRIVKGSSPVSGQRHAPPDRDDPRWGAVPPTGRVQIAGKSCAACGERITLAFEGVPCETCREPCHTKCVARHAAIAHKPDERTPYR